MIFKIILVESSLDNTVVNTKLPLVNRNGVFEKKFPKKNVDFGFFRSSRDDRKRISNTVYDLLQNASRTPLPTVCHA